MKNWHEPASESNKNIFAVDVVKNGNETDRDQQRPANPAGGGFMRRRPPDRSMHKGWSQQVDRGLGVCKRRGPGGALFCIVTRSYLLLAVMPLFLVAMPLFLVL